MKIVHLLKVIKFSKYLSARTSARSFSLEKLPNSGLHQEFQKAESVKHFLNERLTNFVIWYEQLTGMDEVHRLQNKVIDTQEKFILAQEKRRNASRELSDIQNKLKDIYAELDTTSRGEERYLHLITKEHTVLKEERKLQQEFSLLEREERDTFTLLSNCVKESHEKERAQAERTKYWSIIGSVIGTIIGILGSSVNNELKMREVRKLVRESTMKNSGSEVTILTQHEQELSSIIQEMKVILNNHFGNKSSIVDDRVVGRLDELLHSVSRRQEESNSTYMAETIQRISQNIQDLKGMLNTAQRVDGQLIALPADFESLIQAQQLETRIVLVSTACIGVIAAVSILTRMLK